MRNAVIGILVGTLLVVLGLVLIVAADASEIDPNQEFCLTDNLNYYWVLHLYVTPQGHFTTWGHVHNLNIPSSAPLWTRYVNGAGTLYPATHPKFANIADFTVEVLGVPEMGASVKGSIEESPIVYYGTAWVGYRFYPGYELTLLDGCATHP